MPFLYSEGRSIRSQPCCGTPDQSPVTPISAPFSFFGTAQDQRDTKPSRAVALTLLGESVPQLLPPHYSSHHKRCSPSFTGGQGPPEPEDPSILITPWAAHREAAAAPWVGNIPTARALHQDPCGVVPRQHPGKAEGRLGQPLPRGQTQESR